MVGGITKTKKTTSKPKAKTVDEDTTRKSKKSDAYIRAKRALSRLRSRN